MIVTAAPRTASPVQRLKLRYVGLLIGVVVPFIVYLPQGADLLAAAWAVPAGLAGLAIGGILDYLLQPPTS